MILVQKRDSGVGTLTSASDKSSGIKSNSTPSTPQAGSNNFHAESRLSQSLLTASSPPMGLLSDARQNGEIPEDNYLGQETPLVCKCLFFLMCATAFISFSVLHSSLQFISFML